MKKYRIPLLVVLICCLLLLLSSAPAEGLQDCHRVTATWEDTKNSNKSFVRLWTLDTALDEVDAELAAIEKEYVDRIGPTLAKATSNKNNSRLDVSVRYSRTGLSWMSFVIQARTTYHQKLIGQEFTTRTYNMLTGQRITLGDIFPEDSEGWQVLADAVRTRALEYYESDKADEDRLEELCTGDGLKNLDFSLHGMSLVIHIGANELYSTRFTMMEIPLFYPRIRPYMTEEAQKETDNLTYYKTVAITFDDGPSRTNSSAVMNSLMETGTVGTFFVIGNLVDKNRDLVQREHDEGHAVGAHNWHHGTPSKSKPTYLRAMPKKVNTAMKKAIGIPVRYDRVPYGLYNTMIKAGVKWPYIQWSLDTYDWRGRSTADVLQTVKDQISDGDIILCHDIKDNTPGSAKAIAEYLQEEGYMFLTIDELFAKDGVELQGAKVYYRCVDGVTGIKK